MPVCFLESWVRIQGPLWEWWASILSIEFLVLFFSWNDSYNFLSYSTFFVGWLCVMKFGIVMKTLSEPFELWCNTNVKVLFGCCFFLILTFMTCLLGVYFHVISSLLFSLFSRNFREITFFFTFLNFFFLITDEGPAFDSKFVLSCGRWSNWWAPSVASSVLLFSRHWKWVVRSTFQNWRCFCHPFWHRRIHHHFFWYVRLSLLKSYLYCVGKYSLILYLLFQF